jgi:CheY-like chemotaxis protein
MSLDRRILIADDDREVRAGVVDLLRDLDMDFVHAESGIEALQIVRRSADRPRAARHSHARPHGARVSP